MVELPLVELIEEEVPGSDSESESSGVGGNALARGLFIACGFALGISGVLTEVFGDVTVKDVRAGVSWVVSGATICCCAAFR